MRPVSWLLLPQPGEAGGAGGGAGTGVGVGTGLGAGAGSCVFTGTGFCGFCSFVPQDGTVSAKRRTAHSCALEATMVGSRRWDGFRELFAEDAAGGLDDLFNSGGA